MLDTKRKPFFWPAVFLAAFALGAILWGAWMLHVIRQTRSDRDRGFFVPVSAPAKPAPGTATNAR